MRRGPKSPRGRKPMPAALKIATGNKGRREINELEPVYPKDAIDPPEWMDAEAKAEWCRLVPMLEQQKIIQNVDVGLLVSWCEQWSIFRQACEDVHQNGIKVDGRNGMVGNPAVTAMRSAQVAMFKIASEFGFSPCARARLQAGVDPHTEDSEIEMFGNKEAASG